jgi:hypothetical protein
MIKKMIKKTIKRKHQCGRIEKKKKRKKKGRKKERFVKELIFSR